MQVKDDINETYQSVFFKKNLELHILSYNMHTA